MALIFSDFDISGTYGNLVVYQVGSQLYARSKSSLTRKRFLQDPAFARSREKSKQFGIAATLAKIFYGSLSKNQKRQGLFGILTGFITKKLQEGIAKEAIIKELQVLYGIQQTTIPAKERKPVVRTLNCKLKSSQHLSNWHITVNGLLESNSSSKLFPIPSSQIVITELILPDG